MGARDKFTDEERAAFVDGAQVLRLVDDGWTLVTVVGGVVPYGHSEERVKTTFLPGGDSLWEWWCYPTGVRVPGAALGIDYQRLADGAVTVLFCAKCGGTDGQVGVSRQERRGRSTDDLYSFVVPVDDVAHIDDYVFTCTACTKAVGGWPTHVKSREYGRRLAAVRELGYLMESAEWNAERYNDAIHAQLEKERAAWYR